MQCPGRTASLTYGMFGAVTRIGAFVGGEPDREGS